MQNPELIHLPLLDDKWRSSLIAANYLTSAQVLLTSPSVLAKKLKLSLLETNQLLLNLSLAVEQPASTVSQTVAEILQLKEEEDGEEREKVIKTNSFTLGDDGLDSLLGGIRTGMITEIAGESASGKSHLCLQLALTVQLPVISGGLAGGAIIISSEGIIASPRLVTLARSLIVREAETPPSTSSYSGSVDRTTRTEWDYLDNIHIIKAQDMEALETILSYQVPLALAQYSSSSPSDTISIMSSPEPAVMRYRRRLPPLPIRLIILDSIAAPVRAAQNAGSSGLIQRSAETNRVGDALKRLATLYSCAIVVVNQATDVFQHSPLPFPIPAPLNSPAIATSSPRNNLRTNKTAHEQHRLPPQLYSRYQNKHFSGQSDQLGMMAALGNGWANVVNTRIMLSRTGRRRRRSLNGGEGGEQDQNSDVLVRRMSLIFSPCAQSGSIDYVVESDGVKSV